MGSLRVGHDWATSVSFFTFMHWRRKWQPTPVFLPGESQGQGSLVGCHLWGRTESDTTEVTQQQQQHSSSHGAVCFTKLWVSCKICVWFYFWFFQYTEQQVLNSSLLEWTLCPRLSESMWRMESVVADTLRWAHICPAEPPPHVSGLRFKGPFFSHCHGPRPTECWSIWLSHSQDSTLHSESTLMGYWLRVNIVVHDFLGSYLCSTTY